VKRSQRLQTLVKLVQLAERGARERLAQANRELHRREQQQQQLESYEQEYATRWIETGRHGIAGTELAQLGAFRASLADTLAIQERAVGAAREQSVLSAAQWRAVRNRQRMFEDLAARARADEEREAARRLQKLMDDLPRRVDPLDAEPGS
jgi:flagellar FliJ protein